jgi:NAD(P)-dependent dehydrogenase (short-subunit alcohol dehydrogenase family)
MAVGGVADLGTPMNAHRRITTPFTRESTTSDVIAGVDLAGKHAIVTGGACGIGAETARALASAGADVTLAVRNRQAGERAAAEMRMSTGNGKVSVESLELTDRASIAAFTAAWRGPLHVLVNAAGVMMLPELVCTPDGWELHFATNHLGHFELALGLHSALATAGQSRIVVVSSGEHLLSPVIFDDLHFAFRRYDPASAYGQSRTANVLFALGATAHWYSHGITANALNVGAAPPSTGRQNGRLRWTPREIQSSLRRQAATAVLLASSPILEGIGGRYFEGCNEAELTTRRTDDLCGVAPYALNPENADRLWDVSVDMLAD